MRGLFARGPFIAGAAREGHEKRSRMYEHRRWGWVLAAAFAIVAGRARAQENDRSGPQPAAELPRDASAGEVCGAVTSSDRALDRARQCLSVPQLQWEPEWSRAGLGD